MAQIKHPKGRDSVTAQTGHGPHPRGTEAENPERDRHSTVAPDDRFGDPRGNIYGAGKHFADDEGGPDDIQRNPGIGSSKGSSRVRAEDAGVSESDWAATTVPRPRRGDGRPKTRGKAGEC